MEHIGRTKNVTRVLLDDVSDECEMGEHHPSECIPLNSKPTPNNTSHFYDKVVSEVLPTPHTKQRDKGLQN